MPNKWSEIYFFLRLAYNVEIRYDMQMFNVRSAMRLKAAVADSHYRPRSKKKEIRRHS